MVLQFDKMISFSTLDFFDFVCTFTEWGMQTYIFCILKGCTGVHFVRKCKVRRKESFDQLANTILNKRKLYTKSTVKDHGKYFG